MTKRKGKEHITAPRDFKIIKVRSTILTTRFYCNYLGFREINLVGIQPGKAFSLLGFADTKIAIYPDKMETDKPYYRSYQIEMNIPGNDINTVYTDLVEKVNVAKELHTRPDGCLSFSILDCEDNILTYVAKNYSQAELYR